MDRAYHFISLGNIGEAVLMSRSTSSLSYWHIIWHISRFENMFILVLIFIESNCLLDIFPPFFTLVCFLFFAR